ncbi:hypothetical protein [Cerasicoccus fimbriatus]|uniref:hypothetical protein n=1 Tax=Cerasicoccus fimbriatus TaxID=3014554 RepID=UPI0022B5E339|nr:hypothetical protein [Cerasicoccus sp. TK19100]
MQNAPIIAIIVGVVIAALAVALFILTRKPKNQGGARPLVERNPNYGGSKAATSEAPAKPAEKKAEVSSPLKAKPVEKAAPTKAEPVKAAAPAAKAEPAKKEEPKKAEPAPKKVEPVAKKPVVQEEDEWGDDDAWDIEPSGSADLDSIGVTSEEDEFSAGVKAQQEEAEAKPKKMVDRRSSEDDDDDWGSEGDSDIEYADNWNGPTLPRVSPEVKKAFKDESLSQEFHVSKRKEADELIVKCVQAYLKDNENAEVKAGQERIFALHSKIQLSDLPEIIESFVDSGDEGNQKYFADFEDMCNTHEDSVLVLFERFNTTLPINLRSRRIAEITEPMPAVIYLAPEWEDDDFDRPDFDERDEDIDENVDYLEDFYDQLEDDDEEEAGTDKKQA